jgi:hypothetical protein
MRPQDASALRASDSFQEAAGAGLPPAREKPPAPFSLRLSPEERAYLDRQAGGRPLGAYIRERLLGDQARKRQVRRKPKVDDKRIALVLAELGGSRLSSNLNQLAKAANMGTLDVSRDVEQELREACRAVLAMRDALIAALGLRAETGP